MSILSESALPIYAIAASFLAVHMVVLDAFSGLVRGKSKTTPNPEDAGSVSTGAKVTLDDPDPVARVMRAHRNMVANTVPFLIVSLVWVLLGATRTYAISVFGLFIVARLAHSFAYIAGKQPWRSIAFTFGQLALVTVIIQVVRAAVAAL